METTLVPSTGIRCTFFPMAPPTSPHGIVLLALATLRSLALMVRDRPRVVFATGGYVSTPAGFAARLLRIPVVLFLPDVVPGKAVAALAPIAQRIAVTAEESIRHLPSEKCVVTGYPVRDEFTAATREAGRDYFQIPFKATVLCVFGGSQGSRSINESLAGCLAQLLPDTYVIHVCGVARHPEALAAAAGLPDNLRERYRLIPYLEAEDMALAMAASDLALCRSGASILGELPATNTPAILAPLPEGAVHQQENAEHLVSAGAATILPDADLPTRLCSTVRELLSSPERLSSMRRASAMQARPAAAHDIASLVLEVAGGH